MKHLLITGLALALSGSAALAQYADDPYSNNNSGTQTNQNSSSQRYQQNRDYNDNGDTYNSNNQNGDDYNDGYIDYDDDSYTTRMRRFDGMYLGYNYWSPVYSPYWAMPVYLDPWYYSPFRPSFSINFGYSWGSPYWNSGWGMSNWYGYNSFNCWNNPYSYGGYGYGGYGFGYGGYYGYGYGNYGYGYGNGYYENNRRNVNYGPRRSYNTALGNSGRVSSGVRPNPGTTGGVSNGPIRRRDNNFGVNPNSGTRMNGNRTEVNDGVRMDNGARRTRDLQGGNQNTDMRRTESSQPNFQRDNNNAPNQQRQQNNFPDRRFDNNRQTAPQQNMDRRQQQQQAAPERTYQPQRQAPQRNVEVQQQRSAPAPSRSFSAPAPSRSSGNSGGFSGGSGGGSRSSGGSSGGGSRGGGGSRR